MSRSRWHALETKLEHLEQVRADPASGRSPALLREALRDKSNLLAARAAKLISELEIQGFDEDLLRAFERFQRDPVKTDGACRAQTSIMDALRCTGHSAPEVFLRGVQTVQMEPAYGGPVDTAVDLRCLAAVGLVGTNHADVTIELAHLLADREPRARIGAVRAMTYSGRADAIPLLHFKVLGGDDEAGVIGECFDALLKLSPDNSLPFVAGFLTDPNPPIGEVAALAIGESRTPEALGILTGALEDARAQSIRHTLLLAIAMIRSEEAVEFLLDVIREGSREMPAGAVAALGTYRYDDELRQRVQAAAKSRRDVNLTEALNDAFGTGA